MALKCLMKLGYIISRTKASSLHSDISSCLLPTSPGQLTCKALLILNFNYANNTISGMNYNSTHSLLIVITKCTVRIRFHACQQAHTDDCYCIFQGLGMLLSKQLCESVGWNQQCLISYTLNFIKHDISV